MKKFLTLILALLMVAGINSAKAMEGNFDVKLGTSYHQESEKWGFQTGLQYFAVLDKFFAIGLGTGFDWNKWDRVLGTEEIQDLGTAVKKASTNAFSIPVMALAQIRLDSVDQMYGFLPYVTGGAGYGFMFLKYNQPEYLSATTGLTIPAKSKVDFYSGLCWEVNGGVAISPSSDSYIKFLIEGGYSGFYPSKDDLEINMSGFKASVGVRFTYGAY